MEKTDGVIATPASWSQVSKVTLVVLGAMVLLASTDLPAGRETLVREVSLVSKAESLITDLLCMLSLVKKKEKTLLVVYVQSWPKVLFIC